METNDRYIEMVETINKYSCELDAVDREKDEIVSKFGFGSKEADVAYERLHAFMERRPYSSGQMKALRFIKNSDDGALSDSLWDDEIHDFIATLRECGVKEFICVSQSTALMGNIHGFVGNGCVLVGPCKLTEKTFWGSIDTLGLKFEIK